MPRMFLAFLITLIAAAPALAQSQAINATIEGTITDTSGAVLPGVSVTITARDTGLEQVVVTNAAGVYRAALLPLGGYRLTAELQGFKTHEQLGVTLSAGETEVINIRLDVGAMTETVTVTGEGPVADPARISLGRTIGEAEIRNLPNIARNTFNFALLQPNVTGFENEEFGATRMNANGSQMRTNYQIDGSSATQKDRAGLRMFQPSEIMVREVKVITSGFAPEFGQTTGMIYNAITPSGTNQFHGQASYRFRRQDFASRPALLNPASPKPNLEVDNYTATLGGPIARDRAFFYLGYERLKNDLSAGRVITVRPETASLLGLKSDALGNGVIPAVQTVNMFIAKGDAQLGPAHRLSARWSVFNNTTPENIGGGLNTRELSTDFQDRMDSAQAQLVSTLGGSRLNELRVAFGRRDNPRTPSQVAASSVGVQIAGVANFGGPGTSSEFVQEYWQIVDNFSWLRGNHNFKVGFDAQFIEDFRASSIRGVYVFPTTAAYLAAKSGANPFGYTRFTQAVGDPTVGYTQRFYSVFVQDDWRVTPSFKLLYGLRYDLFQAPDGLADAPHAATRSFRSDKNNFGPRLGFAWSLDDAGRSVVRGSTGVMFESPLGMFYQDALQESGAPKLLNVNLTPTQAGAPAFPGTIENLPAGVTPSRSIRIVNPDFATHYAVLSNVQYERALTSNTSASIGYVNSIGRNLPVLLNSNVVPAGAPLPDERPVYSRAVNAATRVDPAFDTINEVSATGRSAYHALTLTLNRRLAGGIQAQASYTLADAKDNGVIGGRYVIGSTDTPGTSDPSNPDRDYSSTAWNVRHTFIASTVLSPTFAATGVLGALLNNNQLGIILQANSGLPFNIRSNRDLNLDGILADRPNGIARNSGRLGRVVNVDARYSRFVPFGMGMRLEVFAEAKNLFDRATARAANGVVATDALGAPLAPIPTAVCEPRFGSAAPGCFPVTGAYESRQMQIGAKFTF